MIESPAQCAGFPFGIKCGKVFPMPPRALRIGLFGGAFDPPHLGHGIAIRQLLDSGLFDEIWVVPSGFRRDKQSVANPKERLEMTERFIRSLFFTEEPVKIRSHLVERPDTLPFTVDEIEFLKEKYPDATFTVSVGPDQARVLDFWHRAKDLFALVDFAVLVRDGRPGNIPKGCRATILDPGANPWMDISSTELRRRLKEGRSVSGLTPLPVIEFIAKRGLYR
ncbi:MAG: hypothetical protein A2991_02180 [Candidatus Terrybacteria bacterium RIFCSPLOWO2_01_FULL_58_14]|uniref:Probable nicotinate-nucleotide adenylyltransferase n=2 Tax=Candidatus Terryibacteriota TaxID=1817920 RepID=A0A1G2PZD7_9BACT|nr:MAG: hypothetical protein A2991_02180 [Candidatus Terrybacteria bacterium RIFCSPLOWO2_01_FULL_58_14]